MLFVTCQKHTVSGMQVSTRKDFKYTSDLQRENYLSVGLLLIYRKLFKVQRSKQIIICYHFSQENKTQKIFSSKFWC